MATPEALPEPEDATWAEDGVVGTEEDPGDVDPDGGAIADGWPETEEPVPRQRLNWLFKTVHQVTRFFRQWGLPTYKAGETYPYGARVQHGDTKDGWKRIGPGTTTGVEPGTDAGKWTRWGHTDDEVVTIAQDTIADELGTISGALADGTVSANLDASVANCRQQCFPGSTDKNVLCKLTLSASGYMSVITLSGAAAFATGIDGAQATLAIIASDAERENCIVKAKKLTSTQVEITVFGITSSVAIEVNVLIHGH